jgi:hypothetical protein
MSTLTPAAAPTTPDSLDDYAEDDLLAAGVDPAVIASTASRDFFYRMASGFSYHVLGRPLRSYQKEVAAAILESVVKGLGLTFTVMMARQMGKNELSAHVEAGLLARHARAGDTLVKAAPTFRPQVTTSMQRLESLLKAATITRRVPDDSPLNSLARRLRGAPAPSGTPTKEVVLKPRKEHGYQLVLPVAGPAGGDARISFLSADPSASVVGATASLLLEVDEAQDVDPEKFTRDFRPTTERNHWFARGR